MPDNDTPKIDWKRYESDMAYHDQVNQQARERRAKDAAGDDWIDSDYSIEGEAQKWTLKMLHEKYEKEARAVWEKHEADRRALNKKIHDHMVEAWTRDQLRLGNRAVLFDDHRQPIASVNMPLPKRAPQRMQRGLEMDFG